jgi:hypothetical protein
MTIKNYKAVSTLERTVHESEFREVENRWEYESRLNVDSKEGKSTEI